MMISANVVSASPLREPAHENIALAEINQTLNMASIGLQFEFAKESGKMIAKVTNVESGEVIRQVPSEEVARLLKALGKLQAVLMHQTIWNKWCDFRGKSQNRLVNQTI